MRPIRYVTRASWAAGALVLVCLLAGCSSSSDADSPSKAVDEADEAALILRAAKAKGGPQQTEALADGHVSVEEMEASIQALEECLASTNWRLESVYPDPIAGEPQFTYRVEADPPDSDDAEFNECDEQHFRFVDAYTQSIQGPAPMDPALLARTHTCLEDAGIRTSPDDRTDDEVFKTAGKKNVQDVVDCMLAAYRTEFPGREDIVVAIPSEVGGG